MGLTVSRYGDLPDDSDIFGEGEHYAEQVANGFRPDAYEQLKLTAARCELANDQKAKFDSLRQCLQLKAELAAAKLEISREISRASEASRDRARQIKLARREKRKAIKNQRELDALRLQVSEAKLQCANAVRSSAEIIDAIGAEIRVLHEKEMLRDMRANLSVELGDFIGCPCCNTPMGEPEAGDGMLCPECEYRTASRG